MPDLKKNDVNLCFPHRTYRGLEAFLQILLGLQSATDDRRENRTERHITNVLSKLSLHFLLYISKVLNQHHHSLS